MCYIYILKCNDGKLYTGWTKDIDRRLIEHNTSKKGSKFTRARRPVEICYIEKFEDINSALKREAEIKKLSRAKKLELISINPYIEKK